jgi:hypothetical protein
LSIPQAQPRAPAPALAKFSTKHHERNDAWHTVTVKLQNIMACTLRQWGRLAEGRYYNARTDPVIALLLLGNRTPQVVYEGAQWGGAVIVDRFGKDETPEITPTPGPTRCV